VNSNTLTENGTVKTPFINDTNLVVTVTRAISNNSDHVLPDIKVDLCIEAIETSLDTHQLAFFLGLVPGNYGESLVIEDKGMNRNISFFHLYLIFLRTSHHL